MSEITTSAQCVARIRTAYDRWKSATVAWADATWELAEALYEARRAQPNNQAFSMWLAENDLDDLGKNDRAALINMARAGDVARQILATADTGSVRRIWENLIQPRLKDRVPSLGKTEPDPTAAPETPEAPLTAGDSSEADSGIDGKSAGPTISKITRNRSALLQRDDGERIWGYHLSKKTRVTLNAIARLKASTQLGALGLIDECISNGAFGVPTHAAIGKPTLRLALPWAPIEYANRFDITIANHRKEIREKVLPVVLGNPDHLRERPQDLPLLIGQRRESKIQAHREKAALANLGDGQEEIITFGKRIWPCESTGLYSYENARNAAWFFDYLVNQFPVDWKPASKAMVTRHLLKWIAQELRNGGGFAIAVQHITYAYERSPDGKPHQLPMRPVNYGIVDGTAGTAQLMKDDVT